MYIINLFSYDIERFTPNNFYNSCRHFDVQADRRTWICALYYTFADRIAIQNYPFRHTRSLRFFGKPFEHFGFFLVGLRFIYINSKLPFIFY